MRDRLLAAELLPSQAFAAVVNGGLVLEDLVGPAGYYADNYVLELLEGGRVPPQLMTAVLEAPGMLEATRRAYANFERYGLGAQTYNSDVERRFVQGPPQLRYALARRGYLRMDLLLQGPEERLRQHIAVGAIDLATDPFLSNTPEAALSLVGRGLLQMRELRGHWSLDALLQQARLRPQRNAYLDLPLDHLHEALSVAEARRAVENRWLSARHYVAKLEPEAAFAALLGGEVRYADVAEGLPRVSCARMVQLQARGQGGWTDWFTRWAHPREELQEAHDLGVLGIASLELAGPNVEATALLLWQAGEIDDARAAPFQARGWDGTAQLPPAVGLLLTTYADLPSLLERLPLPHPPPIARPYRFPPAGDAVAVIDPAQRQRNVQFAALAVASWLQQPERVVVPDEVDPFVVEAAPAQPGPRPHGLEALRLRAMQALEGLRLAPPWARRPAEEAPPVVRLLAAAAAVEAEAEVEAEVEAEAPAALACLSCGDEVEDGELVALAGCNHPPQFDLDCYVRGLEALGGHRCLEPTCLRPLGLADAEQLRLPPARALGIVVRQASEAVLQQPNWARCRTPECLGGRVERVVVREPLNCRCCGVRAPTLQGVLPRYADLDQAARTQVQDLVHFAGITGRDVVGQLRPIRECYHCGMLTEHHDACMGLTCPREVGGCGEEWDFVQGREVAHVFELRPARYVPKSSWLVDLGLYDGLVPGAVGVVGLADVLAANLRRLQQQADGQ